jgi:hypothetical protein
MDASLWMINMSYTGINRTLRALNFQTTDRLPVVGGRIRQTDFLTEVAGVTLEKFYQSPRQYTIEVAAIMGADAIFGPTVPLPDSKIGAASHIRWGQSEFQSPEDVVRFIETLPSLEEVEKSFDANQAYDRYASLMENGQKECGDMLFIPFTGVTCPFHSFFEIFGTENFLMAIGLYPEIVNKLFACEAEKVRLSNQALAAATLRENLVPYVWGGEDICGNQGPVVSPRVLKNIYFPHAVRATAPLREAGIRILWHSDGNIMPIADQLLNNLGVDGFQGLQQETGVDIAKLAAMPTLRGEKTRFAAGVNVPTVCFGTPQDVSAEVELCARLSEERGGGFLLCPASSFGPDVKKENIYALFEYARSRQLKSKGS